MRMQHIIFGVWLVAAAVAAAEPPGTTTRKLTLDDCIQAALEHNLEIQIQRLNPEIMRYSVSLAYAGYDPNFSVSGTHPFNTTAGSFSQSIGIILPPTTTDNNIYSTSLGGLTPIGLNYSLSGNISESYGQNSGKAFGSSSGGASLRLSQPLLKNFWIDSTRMNIMVSKKKLKESELGLRYQVMNIVASVEQAYYNVIAARTNIVVQEKATELAERLLAENKKRVQVGAMAALDEKQAESQVAVNRANLLLAQQSLTVRENTLKSLLTENYSSWQGSTIEPMEPMTATPQAFSLQDSWSKGMTMRPDLLQSRIEVEKQDIMLRYNYNQLFPELDLVGSYGHNASEAARDFGSVLGQLESGRNPTYSYGATLTFSLSRTAARNNYKTSKATKQQLILQLKKLERDILVQIDNAVKQAQTSFERIASTKEARLYSEAALDAEQKKLEQGKSTSFIVLQLQSNLTSARSAEIQALADYNNALAQLALAEGSTLERNHLRVKVK